MSTLTFDSANKVIVVPDTATEVTVQEIYDQSRDYEQGVEGMSLDILERAGGKDALGGDIYTAVTVTLINNWRLKFEDRVSWTTCYVKGGNLVAINDYGNNPIKTSDYVNVIIQGAVAGVIADPDVWDRLLADYQGAGTVGEALKEARDNAELAFVTN